tara:strand:+ start:14284 stop:19020 length:4737 start_codon:yes stop_codon:yes gene_type:complete
MKKFLLLILLIPSILFSQTDSWIKLEIQLDQWPEENCWELREFTTDTLIYDDCGDNYGNFEFIELFIPLQSGQYIFNFVDEYGDGLSLTMPSYVLVSNECQDTLSYVHGFGTSYNGNDSLALANGWTIPGIITQGFTSAAELLDTLTLAPCAPPTTFIPGCMDPIAGNYDSLATIPQWGYSDQSSCTYIIGCMNTEALNYDSTATQDDYTLCIWPPCNGFDTSAVSQSCNGNQTKLTFEWLTTQGLYCDVAEIHYGYDPSASPYVQGQYFQGDVPYGATPPVTFPYTIFECSYYNYNWNVFEAKAGGNFVTQDIPHFFFVKFNDNNYSDTLWITPEPCIVGCTDPNAPSYNPFATIDDGSCQTTGTSCGPDSTTINIILTPDTYSGETSWELIDSTTTPPTIIASSPLYSGLTGIPTSTIVCVDSTMNLVFNLYDSYGDGMCGSCFGGVDGEVLILDQSCGDTLFHLSSPNMNFGVELIESIGLLSPCNGGQGPPAGCTDPGFVEYNPLAIVDDSSCVTPIILGCTDSSYFNYDPSANQMSIVQSCDYTLRLTDGAGDGWYGSYIGILQDDSLYGPYTMYNGFSQDFTVELGTIKPAKIYFFTQGNSFTTADQCGIELINPAGNTTFSIGSNPWNDEMIPYPFVYTTLLDCGNYCEPFIYGCTDIAAYNYDSIPNTLDSSCQYFPGCTDPLYIEYWTQGYTADVDDGSCTSPTVLGCTDSLAFNYDPTANLDNGGCIPILYGCIDATMYNYDVNANTSDGSCIPFIYGCTDAAAFNYDISANTDDGSCIPVVFGCIDSTMWNYDATANTDNGSCVPYIYGCTDVIAFNYDPLANTDDGTCTPVLLGCIDSTALNYNSLANTDDGSCIPYLYGCTDPIAFNYNSLANTDDGSCIPVMIGCMDSTQWNYDSTANTAGVCIPFVYGCTDPLMFNYDVFANADDSSCVPYIYGCTDVTQFNYDALANTDNGSCIPFIYGCTDTTQFNYDPLANTDNGTCISFMYGCTNPIMFNYDPLANTNNGTCIPFIYGCMDSTMFNYNSLANTGNGTCIPFIYGCTDPLAANWDQLANTNDNSCYYNPGCTDANFLQFYTQGFTADFDDGSCIDLVLYGCMDNTMFNYNPNANIDNGSCVPYIYGCMDSTMFNYDPAANTDNSTCIPFVYGCTDAIAANYNPLANTLDGSCYYNPGCTDPLYLQFWIQGFTADYDNGSCNDLAVYGCMNPISFNYDPLANIDDGSCIGVVLGCMDDGIVIDYDGDGLPSLNYNPLANTENGTCITKVFGCMDPTQFNYNALANVDNGSCIPFVYGCMDTTMFNYNPLANTQPTNACVPFIYGCMDDGQGNDFNSDGLPALNYCAPCNTNQISATDVSDPCIAQIFGCTDSLAFNYDSLANVDNGTCIATVYGCTDEFDFQGYLYNTYPNYLPGFNAVIVNNLNPLANTDDGSCLYYDVNTITGAGNPYWLNDTCYAWVVYEVDPYCLNNQWDNFCQSQYNNCAFGDPLSTLDLIDRNSIKIYPNPTKGLFIIEVKGAFDVSIIDMLGNNIMYIKDVKEPIDITNYKPGVYNLYIEYNNMTYNRRIVLGK